MSLKPLIAGMTQTGGDGGGGGATIPVTTNLIAGTGVANVGADAGFPPQIVVTAGGVDEVAGNFPAWNSNADPGVVDSGVPSAPFLSIGVGAGILLMGGSLATTTSLRGNATVARTIDIPDATGVLFLNGGALADGTTATTQATRDFSDKVATTAYVDSSNPFDQSLNQNDDVQFNSISGNGAGLTAIQGTVIAGTFSGVGTATTSFTVTIGVTMGDNSYKVGEPAALNVLSSPVRYVTNKTITTFDVVYLTGLTGTVAFDWLLTV